jgi:hypothetical protein
LLLLPFSLIECRCCLSSGAGMRTTALPECHRMKARHLIFRSHPRKNEAGFLFLSVIPPDNTKQTDPKELLSPQLQYHNHAKQQ